MDARHGYRTAWDGWRRWTSAPSAGRRFDPMKLIPPIKSCHDCPYRRTVGDKYKAFCAYHYTHVPLDDKAVGKPSWCPLPDAKEEKK